MTKISQTISQPPGINNSGYCLKGQHSHDQSRLSTWRGISVLVSDEHSEWKLLAHLCSSNGITGNISFDLIMWGVISSH